MNARSNRRLATGLLALAACFAAAECSRAAQVWMMSCDARWGGVIGKWVKYTNTDTGGRYATLTQAQQVAQRIQQNYQSQGYRVYWQGAGDNAAPTASFCGSGSVKPTCRNMYQVVVYVPGRGYQTTGYAYADYATANYVASYFRSYGYYAYADSTPRCVYPGQ